MIRKIFIEFTRTSETPFIYRRVLIRESELETEEKMFDFVLNFYYWF